MQLKLADLRALGAYTQFSKAEMRDDVLRLIAVTGDLPGDARVSMTGKKVWLVNQDPPDDERDRDDDEEETLPCQSS